MGRLGRGSPRLEWRWLGTLGFPLWGVEMSLGEEQEKEYLELEEAGGGVVREFVAMKDVSGLGGARTSVRLGIGAMLVLRWSGR